MMQITVDRTGNTGDFRLEAIISSSNDNTQMDF